MICLQDIDVCVLTYNRLNYLKEMINSLLNQTVNGFSIIVCDNHSTDGTELYINELSKKYDFVKYIRLSKHMPVEYNYNSAIDNLSGEYSIFFHDDDIVHPQFLEIVIKTINSYNKKIDFVTTYIKSFKSDFKENFSKIESVSVKMFKNKSDFIKYTWCSFVMYDKASIAFPSSVYCTKNIKKITSEYEKYGKIMDKPFMIDSIEDGIAIQIECHELYNYRIHNNQDSQNKCNGPDVSQSLCLINYFRDFLLSDFVGKLVYLLFSYNFYLILRIFAGNKRSLALNEVNDLYKQKKIRFFYSVNNQKLLKKIFFKLSKPLIRILFTRNIINITTSKK